MTSMTAYLKNSSTAGDASVGTREVPVPRGKEVLLRVAGCGICGSDLHAVRSDPGYELVRAPVVLGHEFTGAVESVGDEVTDLAPGDRVVAMSIQGCGGCPTCRRGDTAICLNRQIIGIQYDGGLADYVVLEQRHLIRLPDGLDLTTAAIAEPLSIAVHAVRSRSGVRPGDTVVVSGPGTIGLLCARLAALAGGDVLVLGTAADSVVRLPVAERFGLNTAVVGAEGAAAVVDAHMKGRGVDAWIEASGAVPALASAIELVRRGATITVVAMFAGELTFRPTDAVRKELSMLFSYGSTYDDYVTALRLIEDGSVDAASLITTFPLADAAAAFEATAAGSVVKAVVVP